MIELNDVSDTQTSGRKLPTVVVTGFGLFRDYKLNPSWECVQRLQLKDVCLITEEIPVVYDVVDKRVDQIWNQYKPMLVIHCGVSCLAKCITLETRAIRDHTLYDRPDIEGRLPNAIQTDIKHSNYQKCPQIQSNDSYDCIESKINLKKICEEVNQHFANGSIKMGANLSTNAGRFLCEYIFNSSLLKSTERTAFIHVPDICHECPLEDILSALELTIQTLIKEVMKTNDL